MNKIIVKIIASIIFAIMYGLIIKYTNFEFATFCLLLQIYIEQITK